MQLHDVYISHENTKFTCKQSNQSKFCIRINPNARTRGFGESAGGLSRNLGVIFVDGLTVYDAGPGTGPGPLGTDLPIMHDTDRIYDMYMLPTGEENSKLEKHLETILVNEERNMRLPQQSLCHDTPSAIVILDFFFVSNVVFSMDI
ncbi:PhoH family protein [Striga asiatica]|uniref:PhoH family protein n=1 Tax=Striga asiatica TaxID=4170 RepID=A0A5A7RF83_STRAF|nr:PhoH family protein [Striga asiatica]